jgi:glycosyltransferase involved in cell wall biosynthesis
MDKKLILFTRRFPYHTTEAFIESEIVFLASRFQEIVIFPTSVASFSRSLPSNVRVSTAFADKYKHKKRRLLKALFSTKFYKALSDHKKYSGSKVGIKVLAKYMATYMSYYDFFMKNSDILDADVFYCYWLNEAPLALDEVREQRQINAKIIARAHRYDIYENLDSTQLFWPYRLQTIEKADAIFVISNDGKDYLERKYPSELSNIQVSKLGVADRGYTAKSSPLDILNIVSVSRVHLVKRVDLIYQSIAAFAALYPDKEILWTHFGDGPELREIRLAALSKPSNMSTEFKGNVTNTVIYEHYMREPVDAFINLSSSEGIPVSIMEAISFGIPAIATNVGGNGEIVVAETGILLEENPTTATVAHALSAVLVDKIVSKSQIKQYYLDNYNAEKNYEQFSESVVKLIS